MDDQTLKKLTVGTAVAGALSLGLLGLGSGVASAKPHGPNPPGPSVTHNDDVDEVDDVDDVDDVDEDDDATDDDDYDNDDDNGDDQDEVTAWTPGMPPGQNPLGPPGQVKKLLTIGGVTNPFYGIAPGHWDEVNIEIPETWQPDIEGVTEPLELQFNAETGQWGVYVDDTFVPYPIPLPAPQG